MYEINPDLIDRLDIPLDRFAGQTAIVTGAARGIGEGVATTLAALGAKVVLVDMRERTHDVAEAITASGGSVEVVLCDLSDLSDLTRALATVDDLAPSVDILVNNALHLNAAPVVELELDEWEKTFATNARAPFLLIKHVLPGMLARGNGTIVNMIAYEGSPLAAAYSGTKSALRSLATTVAREVGNDSGVASFSFIPGIVETPLMHEYVIPTVAAVMEITEEAALELVAHNPGYDGFMPVDHCATALAYAIAHADEYHGQVADPFEPLDRIGVIEMPTFNQPEEIDVSGPLSGIYIKQFLGSVSATNRELEHRIDVRTHELAAEKERSEQLLLSILPSPIAKRLEAGEELIADYFEDATVLFADIVGFTTLSATMAPPRVVQVLDVLFSRFDSIADKYEVEKIKTNGDSYMAVGGVPTPQADHVARVAAMALEMVPVIDAIGVAFDLPMSARIGIHSGSVVAGVIGRHKFIYDLWGDTVNTASRMESYGEASRIHCSDVVQARLADLYAFEPRGTIEIKGKGEMPTYFLTGPRA